MIQPAAVSSLLGPFDPAGDGEAAKSKELVLALLRSSEAPFSRRQFAPGHITCSGLVLGPARDRILLVLHRRLQRWLLPGGHVEPEDAAIGDAGRREVVEETGAILVADSNPLLIGVDVHGIPPRRDEPFHLHHDLAFRFQALSADFHISEEVREVAWCPIAEFDRYELPGNIRRGYARAMAHP
ncbi:MAG: NUDIX domain-containing protein [Bryobacteraceae bacterium]|jgi:8-oxo-dGTP pyrophosphatase MutT (NUDIX family)